MHTKSHYKVPQIKLKLFGVNFLKNRDEMRC